MSSSGVELLHSTAIGNIIFGNTIGLNAAGTQAIGNGELGVLIANGAASQYCRWNLWWCLPRQRYLW